MAHFASSRKATPTGTALRFEVLESRLMLSLTSDAPNPPYPTVQHGTGSPPRFGPTWTADDGVSFGTVRVGQAGESPLVNPSAQIDTQGNVTSRVDAWIDFNGDGSFGGPGEQIINTEGFSSNNVHAIRFDVPSWAEPGITYARFRSRGSSVGLGFADDYIASPVNGEVEDYAIEILPARPATGIFGTANTVHDGTGSATFAVPIFAGDIDGNGNIDLISASSSDNLVAWYRQNSDGTFTRFTVGTVADARSVFLADIDGDKDVDIITASFSGNSLSWFENDGSPAVGAWGTANVIPSTVNGPSAVFAADVDRDGDTDVVAASTNNDQIAWYENNGSGTFTERIVNTGALDAPRTVFAADIDRDGHLDIVSSSSANSRITWFENDGNPRDGGWLTRDIKVADASPTGLEELSLVVADFDGDNFMDVATANNSENRIAWYRNDQTPANGQWVGQSLSTTASGAFGVFAADVDSDGDMDVLAASLGNNTVAWYENTGAGVFSPQNIISTTASGATSVFAADLDDDGDLDVASGSRTDNRVAWYENENLPGFELISTNNPLVVSEGGSTDTFTVRLTTQPQANVVFDLSRSDPSEVTITNPASQRVTLTSANWQTGVIVTVAGANDTDVDGPVNSSIFVTVNQALTTDNTFDGVGSKSIGVTTLDNDVALPGDYFPDGIVNAADYGVWRANFGSTTQLAADGNQNNAVDAADYVVWRNNREAASAAGSGAVVETIESTAVTVAATPPDFEITSAQVEPRAPLDVRLDSTTRQESVHRIFSGLVSRRTNIQTALANDRLLLTIAQQSDHSPAMNSLAVDTALESGIDCTTDQSSESPLYGHRQSDSVSDPNSDERWTRGWWSD